MIATKNMNADINKTIEENIHLMGIHISPVHCDLIAKALDRLDEIH